MFSTHHDQENLVHGHQQVAASKPLNQGTRGALPKTPGNKYPKTPLKIPLNDENAAVFGGKSVMGTKKKGNENLMTGGGKKANVFGKNTFVTPMANRAPLGVKTTNAKTKAFKTPGPAEGKPLDKAPQPISSTSVRRPKKVSHAETTKLNIHGDEAEPLEVPDVEYAPPNPPELPYESDVFPDGSLDYSMFAGANMTRGVHPHFANPLDENGVSKKQKEHDDAVAHALKDAEAKILRAMEEQDWSVGDVPETWPEHRQPTATLPPKKRSLAPLTAGHAASALSIPSTRPPTAQAKPRPAAAIRSAPKPKFTTAFLGRQKPAPPPPPPPTHETQQIHAAAVATSRTTIGYTKGRAASGFVQRPGPANQRPISRAASTLPDAEYHRARSGGPAEDGLRDLPFLKAFDREGDEGLGGFFQGDVFGEEGSDEEEFVMSVNIK